MAARNNIHFPTPSASAPLTIQGERLVICFDAYQSNDPKKDLYLPKKVAIYNIDRGSLQTWMFGAPFDWYDLDPKVKTANQFISCYITGTSWFDGYLPYQYLQMILLKYTERASEVYTKGANCAKYLTNILGRHVINIEPLIAELPPTSVENLMRTVPTTKCMMDHTRICFRPGYDTREYSCCQDRAYFYGHCIRTYLAMPTPQQEALERQRTGDEEMRVSRINRHDMMQRI